jgi:hypothetical protein
MILEAPFVWEYVFSPATLLSLQAGVDSAAIIIICRSNHAAHLVRYPQGTNMSFSRASVEQYGTVSKDSGIHLMAKGGLELSQL